VFSPALCSTRTDPQEHRPRDRDGRHTGAPPAAREDAKTREIAKMLLDAGVTKHKCATIREAEMLAGIGAPDVLIAYPLVGPNVGGWGT